MKAQCSWSKLYSVFVQTIGVHEGELAIREVVCYLLLIDICFEISLAYATCLLLVGY